jgi:hypothetical protein
MMWMVVGPAWKVIRMLAVLSLLTRPVIWPTSGLWEGGQAGGRAGGMACTGETELMHPAAPASHVKLLASCGAVRQEQPGGQRSRRSTPRSNDYTHVLTLGFWEAFCDTVSRWNWATFVLRDLPRI